MRNLKLILFISALLLLSSCTIILQSTKPNKNSIDSKTKNITPNINQKKQNLVNTGSGFLIDKNGLIATNAHVIKGAKRIQVSFCRKFGALKYNAQVMIHDKFNDVAILKIVDNSFKGFGDLPYNIVEKTNIGEDVFTIGFPLSYIMGQRFKVSDGIISANTGVSDDVRYLQTNTVIHPGNSGGPLFNNNGDIVGLVSSKLKEEFANNTKVENINYAIKTPYVMNIYNMISDEKLPSKIHTVEGKNLEEKVLVLSNYVCLIKVTL